MQLWKGACLEGEKGNGFGNIFEREVKIVLIVVKIVLRMRMKALLQ